MLKGIKTGLKQDQMEKSTEHKSGDLADHLIRSFSVYPFI